MNVSSARNSLAAARRLVVKVGSRALVQRNGRIDRARIEELVRQVVALHQQGVETVLVSSGAIAAGMAVLGMARRPTNMPEQQMAAAVGQLRLMATYGELFRDRGCRIGQVLITHDDLKHRARHLNARHAMLAMLRARVVPIVNENDAVAVEEIKFGDNDQLASLVSLLVEADALVLLTTVDGVREPRADGRTRRVPVLEGVSDATLSLARGKGDELSTGGMLSKLQSAGMVVANGIPVVIANGRKKDALLRACRGEDEGTLVLPVRGGSRRSRSHRKRWIACFHRVNGDIIVDTGARDAIVTGGRSLLAIGIRDVQGSFPRAAVVNIKDPSGTVFARGLCSYGSDEIMRIRGRRSGEIASILGSQDYDEVIHRDNLALLGA